MRKPDRIFILYVLLSVLYIGLNLSIPFEQHVLTRYGLTSSEARALQLTVLLPYAVIWFAAFWGSTRLKKYALLIEKSKDGKALSYIADGLMLLAAGLPIGALFSTVQSYARTYFEEAVPFAVISAHYVDIIIGLVAFSLIYKGAGNLLQIIKNKTSAIYEKVFIGLFLVLGTAFTFFTLKSPYRQFPDPDTGRAIYYLPDVLLVLTVVVPLLAIWYMGLSSAFAVQSYRQNVKGLLYRRTLGYVASGILFVITSRIVLRFISLTSQTLNNAPLGTILIILYFLLLLIAAGFVLIAVGTRKLKKIEEV